MVEEKYENKIYVRISHNDKARLQSMCNDLNCNLSNFVREAIREKISLESQRKKELRG